MPSSHLILCHPLLLLPPIPPNIRVFSNESALRIRWPKYWSFSFSIIPFKEHPWLISFRMDWLDLLAVQGTLKSLLQHHSSKASILWCSAFFTVQFSHPYMSTGETIALTRWTFAGKVMSLLLNMLSSLVITSLPRSKHLLISWLQSPSAVILEPRKIKSATVSTVSPSISHEVMGADAMILGSFRVSWFGRRKWQPTPVFLPGESYGQRSLAGYSPRGHKELDMTEQHTRWHEFSLWASQVALVVKNLPAKARDIRDMALIPASGRSPRGGHGKPLQYSCLGNSLDKGACGATVHRIAKSWPQLKQLSIA